MVNGRAWISAGLLIGSIAAAPGCNNSSSSSTSGGTSSATTRSHVGGTLRLQEKGNPESLDPATAYQTDAWQILVMTNDGLTGFKRVDGAGGGTLVPDLAKAIPAPTDGGRTYTFRIRRGIRFSNGEPVVPSDLVRAWERDFRVGSPGTWTLANIVGASSCTANRCDLTGGAVADDSAMTLTVHLTRADPEFLEKVALPFSDAVPPQAPDKPVGTHPLPATGPYLIKSYIPNQSITVVRNPMFHEWSKAAQPAGYPNQMVWHLGLSADAEVTNVENGQADWMFDPPPPERLNELATSYASQLHIRPQTATYFFFLNTRVRPFNNLDARRAVNMAVDRAATVKLYGGSALAQPTCQVLPPDFPGYAPYCPYTANPTAQETWTAPDPAQARSLIAASGTKGQHVTVWSDTTTLGKSLGEYVISLLDTLGYRATLKTLDQGVYFDAVDNSTNKVQIGFWAWYQDYPAASDFINTLLSCDSFVPNSTSNNNPSQFCDPKIDHRITRALALENTQPAIADNQWAGIDRQITNEAPWLSLFNPKNIDFVSKRVGNYQFSPQWFFLLDQAWVQ